MTSEAPPAIVHVNDIASVASTLMAEQRRRGYDTRILDLPKPGASLASPWKLAFVPLRLLLAAGSTAPMRFGGPKVLHIHYATQAFVGPIAGRPFVMHCHGSDIRDVTMSSMRGRYLRALAGSAAAVLYSTPDLQLAAIDVSPTAQLMPNPIDCNAFISPGPAERDVLLGIRLHPGKGAALAIEAISALLRARPETSVTVILDGPLATMAQATLIGDVEFVQPVAHDRMPALLAAHRLTVGQFRIPALGQYELEALAAGVPVVGPLPLPVQPDDPAPIVIASEAGTVASSLADLLDHPDARRQIADEGRAWVRRRHDVGVIVDALDGIYRAALGKGGRETAGVGPASI